MERDGVYKLEFDQSSDESHEKCHFTWSGLDGLIKSDSESSYTIIPVQGIPIGKLQRAFNNGRCESYLWNPKTLVEFKEDGVGSVMTKFIGTPGKTYMAVGSRTTAFPSGAVTRFVNHYGEDGRIMRCVDFENEKIVRDWRALADGYQVIDRVGVTKRVSRIGEAVVVEFQKNGDVSRRIFTSGRLSLE